SPLASPRFANARGDHEISGSKHWRGTPIGASSGGPVPVRPSPPRASAGGILTAGAPRRGCGARPEAAEPKARNMSGRITRTLDARSRRLAGNDPLDDAPLQT